MKEDTQSSATESWGTIKKDTDICIHTKEKDHISKNKKVDQATLLTEESKTE